jgi:hypothetical protein
MGSPASAPAIARLSRGSGAQPGAKVLPEQGAWHGPARRAGTTITDPKAYLTTTDRAAVMARFEGDSAPLGEEHGFLRSAGETFAEHGADEGAAQRP